MDIIALVLVFVVLGIAAAALGLSAYALTLHQD